jgi:hypothetical protein
VIALESRADVGSGKEKAENVRKTLIIGTLPPKPPDVRLVSALDMLDRPDIEDCRLSGRDKLRRFVIADKAIVAKLPLIRADAPVTFLN